MAVVEHVNVTVEDAAHTAAMLCKLFDWRVRWQGDALGDGFSIHVGEKDSYLAVYTAGPSATKADRGPGVLNHIGVVVDDLDMVEGRVKAAGYTPTMHADYEPGRRFYFTEENGIEIEVVSYA